MDRISEVRRFNLQKLPDCSITGWRRGRIWWNPQAEWFNGYAADYLQTAGKYKEDSALRSRSCEGKQVWWYVYFRNIFFWLCKSHISTSSRKKEIAVLWLSLFCWEKRKDSHSSSNVLPFLSVTPFARASFCSVLPIYPYFSISFNTSRTRLAQPLGFSYGFRALGA